VSIVRSQGQPQTTPTDDSAVSCGVVRPTEDTSPAAGSWASSAAARATMVANRSRDTRPEMRVRRELHARGMRYRVAARPVPKLRSTADIVFRPVRVAVFIDGCFWHSCPDHGTRPTANGAYWSNKLQRNRERDAQTDELLSEAGWLVIRVWEHENAPAAASRIVSVVRDRRAALARC
jgi:DNA mismatch endonuclease (patch repair protein)